MAGGKTGIHMMRLKPVRVPDSMQLGDKFVKWDDDSVIGTPVTLRVDAKGYIMYWQDQHKEVDCLDISLIRDTRTGRFAKIPKDVKLREMIDIGQTDIPLEDKMVTICYGTDMVNVNFINFAAISLEVAKEWTEELFRCAHNLLALNASPLAFLEKCHTKLCVMIGPNDNGIPVRNIVRMFAQHRDDRKKIEKALEASKLPSGKNESIDPRQFTLEKFLTFYYHLCGRTEIDDIFAEMSLRRRNFITAEQFRDFLNTQQRDPRLNEILYPYCDLKKAQQLIEQFETTGAPGCRTQLTKEGLLRYLLSDENGVVPPNRLDIHQDMEQSLALYFINSSHNTYLTGHQLTGRSSVEMYRQVLLTGCRCIELDCWDGKGTDEEPIITHGFTMCSEVLFKEVLEAIAESAFKVSDFPVILSFENHCSPKQQSKMAHYCRTILGSMLLTDPLESNPLKAGKALPSPEQLKRKFIIKAKKVHFRRSMRMPRDTYTADDYASLQSGGDGSRLPLCKEGGSILSGEGACNAEDTQSRYSRETTMVRSAMVECDEIPQSSESELDSEEEDEMDLSDNECREQLQVKRDKGTAGQEAEVGQEMSALVIYIQPIRFHGFEYADKRNRGYECTSFVETQALTLLKESPVEFVNFNKRQITRIYPKGTRVDSSNYIPQLFWNAGCQLVALNFQTLDLPMQLNLGLFEYNGRCGYLLKSDLMRRKDRHFDPFSESTLDGIVAGTVEIQIISGQFLTDKKVSTYVEVDMFGLPADTVRKKFRTRLVPANGINPTYNEEPFTFRKVVMPAMAVLRIAAFDENGKLLGHRVLPIDGLRPGYRHICLRNELNQPQNLAMLFVHLSVRDYVSDALADFAAALTNPIAYQSQLEKHAQQLAVLEDNAEVNTTKGSLTATSPAVSANSATIAVTTSEENVKSAPTSRSLSRNASVTSAHGHHELNRIGSLQAKYIRQESLQTLGLASTAGGKSTSLPSSPMHNVLLAENGASKHNSRHEVNHAAQLKDPNLLAKVTLNSLKAGRIYTKLVLKMEKEVESLRKQQDKTRLSLLEVHRQQEETSGNTAPLKSRLHSEKLMQFVKRASRRGVKGDDHKCSPETQKQNDVKEEQSSSFRAMCIEHCQNEHDLLSQFHVQLHETLLQEIEASREGQLRQLDNIHERVVYELKKQLDQQSREDMKSVSKRHKDKSELARMKREMRQKHIALAVQERQMLRDLLEKRKTDVIQLHEQLLRQAHSEHTQTLNELRDDLEHKLLNVQKEVRPTTTQSVSRDSPD